MKWSDERSRDLRSGGQFFLTCGLLAAFVPDMRLLLFSGRYVAPDVNDFFAGLVLAGVGAVLRRIGRR